MTTIRQVTTISKDVPVGANQHAIRSAQYAMGERLIQQLMKQPPQAVWLREEYKDGYWQDQYILEAQMQVIQNLHYVSTTFESSGMMALPPTKRKGLLEAIVEKIAPDNSESWSDRPVEVRLRERLDAATKEIEKLRFEKRTLEAQVKRLEKGLRK